MAVEVKRGPETKRKGLTDPELFYDKALEQARVLIEDAVKQRLIALESPKARSLLTHFLAPMIIEEESEELKERVGRWGPLTSLQVYELVHNQNIREAIEESKQLAEEKREQNFQDVCLISGIDPQSGKASELYGAIKKVSEFLAGRISQKSPSQN